MVAGLKTALCELTFLFGHGLHHTSAPTRSCCKEYRRHLAASVSCCLFGFSYVPPVPWPGVPVSLCQLELQAEGQ